MPEHIAPPAFTSADLQGRRLAGRYRVGSVIAAGGMAQVRRAIDEVLGREVAIKILHPHLAADPVLVDRFRREAVAAARLTHPAIVSIYDTVAEDGINAIVMELIEGITLRQFLDQRGPLDPADAIDIVTGVAEALQVAHEAGIVHRDVKPANILLCDDRRVKVTDFGIAKAGGGRDLTEVGTMIGTAKYLAPEQVRGESVDPRTDIYGLGVVLYECLTGVAPFDADTEAATALARLHRDPLRPRQVRPSIPRSLDAVTMEALARDPNDRPATASDLRAMLLGTGPDPRDAPGTDHTIIGPLAEAAAAEPESFTRSERGWLVPTVLVMVIGLALALSGVLIGRTETGQEIFDRARQVVSQSNPNDDPIGPIGITRAEAFDPIGGDSENDDLAHLAVDGDPGTQWYTEFYNVGSWDRKGGVGLVVVLDRPATLAQVVVDSPTVNWAAQIHVSDQPQASLAEWGDAVGERRDIAAGPATFDLDAARGGAVLIWFTDLGDFDNPEALRLHVSEVTVRGR